METMGMEAQDIRRAWALRELPELAAQVDAYIDKRRAECFAQLAETLDERTGNAYAALHNRYVQEIAPLKQGRRKRRWAKLLKRS